MAPDFACRSICHQGQILVGERLPQTLPRCHMAAFSLSGFLRIGLCFIRQTRLPNQFLQRLRIARDVQIGVYQLQQRQTKHHPADVSAGAFFA